MYSEDIAPFFPLRDILVRQTQVRYLSYPRHPLAVVLHLGNIRSEVHALFKVHEALAFAPLVVGVNINGRSTT
jgi:hypothetical protein